MVVDRGFQNIGVKPNILFAYVWKDSRKKMERLVEGIERGMCEECDWKIQLHAKLMQKVRKFTNEDE